MKRGAGGGGDEEKFKIRLSCLGRCSHKLVDCAWRGFDLTIQIFALYEPCETPHCPFQHYLHLLKRSLKFSPKAEDFFSMLRASENVNPTTPGCRVRDPII